MAMVKCPECGQEISDKAKKCVHCGKVLIEEEVVKEEIKCIECGATLSQTDEMCSNCGCPIEKKAKDSEISPQQVEVTSIKMKKRTKQIILIIVTALIICLGGGIGFKIYSDIKEEQNYQKSYNEYIDNLEAVQILMLTGGSDAETLCNLTSRVWYNAIYKEESSTTDKYTRENNGSGPFYDDFNDALINLYSASSTINTISDIESNQASVKELMKKLQNPPKGLDKCYDTVSDLYDAYKTLTDLAISPSGSYNEFNGNKNDVVSEFMSAYEKLDNQIPEKLKNK